MRLAYGNTCGVCNVASYPNKWEWSFIKNLNYFILFKGLIYKLMDREIEKWIDIEKKYIEVASLNF